MNKTLIILLAILFNLTGNLKAQDTLSLDEAIRIGLENNYSLVLAKNNLEIAKNNNTMEFMLPQVGVNAAHTNNSTNSYLLLFSGPPREGTNLRSTNFSASAMLNWTIFDGMNMFATKEKLEEFERMGETELRRSVENLVAQIIMSYYNVLLQQRMLQQLNASLEVSAQRKNIIESKYSIGMASQLSLSQTQADFNTDSSNFLRQQVTYRNAQAMLNRLLVRPPETSFNVASSINLEKQLNYQDLESLLKNQNTEILLARQNERLTDLTIDQEKSGRYPQLSLFGGMNYSRSTAEIGFAQVNRNYGPVYGAAISWNLYGGGQTNRAVQNAKIQRLSQEAQRKEIELNAQHDLYALYNQYAAQLNLIEMEEKNLRLTEYNVKVAMESYRVGSLTDVELRAIQNTRLETSARWLSAVYQAKQLETELLRMTGKFGLQ